MRALLEQNSSIETDSAYVRLINFAAEPIELELFAYVLTAEADVFRVVREQVLLEVATPIESAGSALTPTKYVELGGAGSQFS